MPCTCTIHRAICIMHTETGIIYSTLTLLRVYHRHRATIRHICIQVHTETAYNPTLYRMQNMLRQNSLHWGPRALFVESTCGVMMGSLVFLRVVCCCPDDGYVVNEWSPHTQSPALERCADRCALSQARDGYGIGSCRRECVTIGIVLLICINIHSIVYTI